MHAAIRELLPQFLVPEKVEASFAVMGLDTQLIEDGTYFVVEADGKLAGCGGWSRRATLFGHNHTAGRENRLLPSVGGQFAGGPDGLLMRPPHQVHTLA